MFDYFSIFLSEYSNDTPLTTHLNCVFCVLFPSLFEIFYYLVTDKHLRGLMSGLVRNILGFEIFFLFLPFVYMSSYEKATLVVQSKSNYTSYLWSPFFCMGTRVVF